MFNLTLALIAVLAFVARKRMEDVMERDIAREVQPIADAANRMSL